MSLIRGEQYSIGYGNHQLRPASYDQLATLKEHRGEVSRVLAVCDTVDHLRAAVLANDDKAWDIHPDAGCVALLDFPVSLPDTPFDETTFRPSTRGQAIDAVDAHLERRADGTETFEASGPSGTYGYEKVPSGNEYYRFEQGGQRLEALISPENGTITITPFAEQA